MKRFSIFVGIFIFLVQKEIGQVQTAAIICSETNPTSDERADHKVNVESSTVAADHDVTNRKGNKNSLNKLLHSIQCTLEKAKPWVDELQQEAKRLEEAAKVLGLGILNSFSEFVDKLVEEKTEPPSTQTSESTTVIVESLASSAEIDNEITSEYLCPEGFVANINGVCERIV